MTNEVRYDPEADEGYLLLEGDEIVFVRPAKNRSTAKVVPFPIGRQRTRIENMRKRSTTFPKRSKEWLAAQIEKHADRLSALGVEQAFINREVDQMTIMLGLMPPKEEVARA